MKESSIQDIEFRSRVAVLFHAAATLSPVNLRLLVGECGYVDVGVPRFPRAASVEPQGLDIAFADPRISWLGFPTLERLSITSCRVNLTDLVLRCPNLRSFKLREDHGSQHMNTIIRSTSLEDLDVDTRIPCIHRFDIRALKASDRRMSFVTTCGIIARDGLMALQLFKGGVRPASSLATLDGFISVSSFNRKSALRRR
ncbi:hypothetical protein ZWY2020_051536 [Hordeum vulgare]|nr:hypothetical protein ZWY2020_051536 [Hordeum vulgare]